MHSKTYSFTGTKSTIQLYNVQISIISKIHKDICITELDISLLCDRNTTDPKTDSCVMPVFT